MIATDGSVAKANMFASGTVLWRRAPDSRDGIEVALIHRPHYGDWSFPKGKLHAGETTIVAAVRETEEETGMRARLGRHLGRITYPVTGHRKLKRVDYWAAEALDGEFAPNDEVDKLMWVPPSRVLDELSYPMDRRVLRVFRRVPADTKSVLLVRHAKAGRRSRYKGDDRLRPLDELGNRQAAALVPNLLAFGPTHVHSADRTRCEQTVQPLADHLGVTIRPEPLLSEEGYNADRSAGRAQARKIARQSGVRVICSQGKVIPDLTRWWTEKDGVVLPPARNRKASLWVLSFHDDRMVAADHIDSPLPLEVPPKD